MPQNDHVVCKKNLPTAKPHQLVRTFSVRKRPNKQLIWPQRNPLGRWRAWCEQKVVLLENLRDGAITHIIPTTIAYKPWPVENIYIYNLSLNHKGYQVKVRKTTQFRLSTPSSEARTVPCPWMVPGRGRRVSWLCNDPVRLWPGLEFLWSLAHIKNLWFRLHFERGPIKNAHFMTWQAKHPKRHKKCARNNVLKRW